MSSSPSKPVLKLDWCSHEAAKYAVEHWHYSKAMPSGKTARVGVWEDGNFIGCVLFGRGSNQHIGKDIGLDQTRCVELVRVALRGHMAPVSRIVAIAVRLLRQASPGLRCIVSFADALHGHTGTIYQAAGWIYTGQGTQDPRCRSYKTRTGAVTHWRTVCAELGKRGYSRTVEDAMRIGYEPQEWQPKYRYLMPLDAEMRARILPLAKPYPKRPCATSIDSDAPGVQPGDGGASPTVALQNSQDSAHEQLD